MNCNIKFKPTNSKIRTVAADNKFVLIPRRLYLIIESRASGLTGICLAKTITFFKKFQLSIFPSMAEKRVKITLNLKMHLNVLRTTGLLYTV